MIEGGLKQVMLRLNSRFSLNTLYISTLHLEYFSTRINAPCRLLTRNSLSIRASEEGKECEFKCETIWEQEDSVLTNLNSHYEICTFKVSKTRCGNRAAHKIKWIYTDPLFQVERYHAIAWLDRCCRKKFILFTNLGVSSFCVDLHSARQRQIISKDGNAYIKYVCIKLVCHFISIDKILSSTFCHATIQASQFYSLSL